MGKVAQFIHLKDSSGVLKNLSELLQEARDGNIESLFLGYTRNSGGTRVFWSGNDIAELNLLLDTMKNDLATNLFGDGYAVTYSEE